jgi:hypothetical protein
MRSVGCTRCSRDDDLGTLGAILPSGRVNEAGIGMISFNHYAFGAVADWLPVVGDPRPRPGREPRTQTDPAAD